MKTSSLLMYITLYWSIVKCTIVIAIVLFPMLQVVLELAILYIDTLLLWTIQCITHRCSVCSKVVNVIEEAIQYNNCIFCTLMLIHLEI